MFKYDAFAKAIENFEDFKSSDEKVNNYLELKFKDLTKRKDELNNFKENKREYFIGAEKFQNVQKISGIFFDEVENKPDRNSPNICLKNLPPYSFIILASFTLKQPYFSKDDDEFYIISNPVLKEKAFKVPMIRGSSWKGALAAAFKDLLNEETNPDKRAKMVDSYLRIFGAGSESIKAIEDYLKEKSSNIENFKEKLLEFIFFELGLVVDKNLLDEIKKQDSYEKLKKILEEQISKKCARNSKDLPIEFQTHKGRTVFYPTYFDRLSLEVINPHDRRKRAGTQPIYYEVVPEGTKGILQIIYIPFDGILKEDKVLKSEAEQDLENLLSAVDKLSEKGIGAKTKLGWGTFDFCEGEEQYYFTNKDLDISEKLKSKGWRKCQG
ncbi:protein of unknown function DUF324 [Caldicellulosiruptor acetigenus I77R1B]|uniref:CRISPR type III-associated protein domain-containing protein n=1 Tax=Caldicellulosiruptor acetigenus (strain ATCC 700853 / DSM 12137 / I77R1B) TaxID=632335 RepID=E4S8Y2_CALA7|nr:protein of unknown function DUF324 [Caldicellulosiruptor acetigenus I77R1B]